MLAQKDTLFAGASQALHNILQDRREQERIQSHIDAMLLVEERERLALAENAKLQAIHQQDQLEIARLKAELAKHN